MTPGINAKNRNNAPLVYRSYLTVTYSYCIGNINVNNVFAMKYNHENGQFCGLEVQNHA